MRRPLALCRVRRIEARTGVPAVVCSQLATHTWKRFVWRDSLLVAGLFVAMMAINFWLWWAFVGWLLTDVFDGPSWLAQLLCILPPTLVVGLAWGTIYAGRFGRVLNTFRDEPWCLNCRYPVHAAAPSGEGSAVICPECGEPIPPEIAKLAAERGNAKG